MKKVIDLKPGDKMKKLEIGGSLENDQASQMYKDILENETCSEKSGSDEEVDVSLLSQSGLYEINFEYHDDIVCYIKRVA